MLYQINRTIITVVLNSSINFDMKNYDLKLSTKIEIHSRLFVICTLGEHSEESNLFVNIGAEL